MKINEYSSGKYELENDCPEGNEKITSVAMNGREDLIEAYNLIQVKLKEIGVLY